jgi:Protein of unknown function (DUF2628)
MKTFNIYEHPELGVEAIKQGFCWPGFFLGGFWLFICRVWGKGFLVILLQLLSGVPEIFYGKVGEGLAMLLNNVILIFIAYNANEWEEAALLKRGFIFNKTVEAETPGEAICLLDKTQDVSNLHKSSD